MVLFSFLRPADQTTVANILYDLDQAIDGEWILGGSLSYRLLLPEGLRSDHFGDIDIVVVPNPGKDIAAIVLPQVKNTFYVSHIYGDTGHGYYFGLIHKSTNRWVDVYTYTRAPEYKSFKLGNKTIKIQAIEETLFAIIKDLLWRAKDKKIIKQKWLNNAQLLWDNSDHGKVLKLLDENRSEYAKLLSASVPKKSEDIIQYVLTQIHVFTPPDMPKGQPDDCVVTKNGITIEPPQFYAEL